MATELIMYRGDDRDFPLTLTEGGSPIDLTGYTLKFTATEDIDDDEYTFQLTTPTEIEITSAADGEITLHVPATATEGLDRGVTLLCDIELTDPSGKVRTAPEPLWNESTLIRLRIRADVT